MRRTLLATVLILGCLAGALATPAQADIDADLNALGDRVWGPSPHGPITTVWADPDQAGVPNAAAWTDGINTIYINQNDQPLPGPFLCQRWLHERGHIAGYQHPIGAAILDDQGNIVGRDHDHSPRLGSIMYPDLAELRGWEGRSPRYVYRVDRRCATFHVTPRSPLAARSRTGRDRRRARLGRGMWSRAGRPVLHLGKHRSADHGVQ